MSHQTKTSIISGVNPVIKTLVLFGIAFLSIAFSFHGPGWAVIFSGMFILFAMSGVTLADFKAIFGKSLVFLLVLFLIQSFQFNPLKMAFDKGAVALLQALSLILAATSYVMTTPNSALLYTWSQILFPLKLFKKRELEGLILIPVLAIRFVPEVFNEFNRIRFAQAARGISYKNTSILAKAKNLVSILYPLINRSVIRAADVAQILYLRGFASSGPARTFYKEYKIGVGEFVYAVSIGILFFAAFKLDSFIFSAG